MSRNLLTASLAALVGSSAVLIACSGTGGDGSPSVSDEEALATHTVGEITTISYAPNSFVIGNAYPGWHDAVQGPGQFSKGPGNPNGVDYRWGFLYGENFDACAWIGNGSAVQTGSSHPGNKCGAPQEIDTSHFSAKYTNGTRNHKISDGSLTYMHYAGSGCTDHNGYGNVAPWRVPATPANATGAVPNGRPLYWRYVSKDGDWVLVHDPTNNGSESVPNWYFVQRGCVSLANAN